MLRSHHPSADGNAILQADDQHGHFSLSVGFVRPSFYLVQRRRENLDTRGFHHDVNRNTLAAI